MLIRRIAHEQVVHALNRHASVALIGPRQVGKTTLALQIAQEFNATYLDLERPNDRLILDDPEYFLANQSQNLVVLDEVQRAPNIFSTIRGAIDRSRRQGRRTSMFLFLGSASMDLLRQSSESLAGRIAYANLDPINVMEASSAGIELNQLWVRGGFPESLIAKEMADSFEWRSEFIRTYIERDIPFLVAQTNVALIDRLWTMLAYSQGSLLNQSSLSRSLGVSVPTVKNYISTLEKMLLIRMLRPFQANVRKQYAKSPKVYVRDSGLTHALLGLKTDIQVYGNPVVGHSWEGFVIENVLSVAPPRTQASFYRTARGAEIDLILQFPGDPTSAWALEIKRSLSAKVRRGFYSARHDIAPRRSFVVHSGTDRFMLNPEIEGIGLIDLCKLVAEQH